MGLQAPSINTQVRFVHHTELSWADLGTCGRIFSNGLVSPQKSVTTEDHPGHSFPSAGKWGSSFFPKYSRMTPFLQRNVRAWEEPKGSGERAELFILFRPRPSLPTHSHGWNQTPALEGISFLMRGEGICGPQKDGQVMDVVTFQISLCILPRCSPGIFLKNFLYLICTHDWRDHWADRVQ